MPYDPLTLINYLQSLPRANQSAIPPNFYAPQNPVPQGFTPPLPTPNPMRMNPTPQPSPGINPVYPQAGASGSWGNPYQNNVSMGPNLGDMLAQAFAGASQGHPPGGLGPASAQAAARQPGPSTPMGGPLPSWAQMQSAYGPGAPLGLGVGRPPGGIPAGTYGLLGPPPPSVPITNPPATGGAGELPTGQPQPVYPKPAKPKPKPKPRPQPQGNQAKYTSGNKWEQGRSPGYYEGLSGGFGSESWRRPKR